jgi:hypothetical protein
MFGDMIDLVRKSNAILARSFFSFSQKRFLNARTNHRISSGWYHI